MPYQLIEQRVLGAEGLLHTDNHLIRSDNAFDLALAELYSNKVYGEEHTKKYKPTVSIVKAWRSGDFYAYNAEQVLTQLWELYGHHVQERDIQSLDHVEELRNMYYFKPKVISTIPASVLFPERKYLSTTAKILVGTAPPEESFIYYNVSPANAWYRCSAVFGQFTQEYPHWVEPRNQSNLLMRTVHKVIGVANSDEVPLLPSDMSSWLHLTGRYGAWDKSMLTHDVYDDVAKLLEISWS